MEWDELRKVIIERFNTKSREMGISAYIELSIIEDSPIDGEFVYGEAFPKEGRVWLEVVGPDAFDYEIMETICHELLHLKYPGWDHDSEEFEVMVKCCMRT